jgi:hypothetical protein
MIGASGSSTLLHYPNPTQTAGLYDSSSHGGTVFYNRRISRTQYFGATYQYQDMLTSLAGGTDTTQTHTVNGFYSVYPVARLSLSVSGGPQHYQVAESQLPAMGSWGPFISPSVGWQGNHTNFSASYSQSVTGGGGLVGAYHSTGANAAARWQMSRTWTVSASGAYALNKSVSAVSAAGTQGGHTVTGVTTLEHSIWNQFSLTFNYEHINQKYDGIPAISSNPNIDRETISINWNFMRPLGR